MHQTIHTLTLLKVSHTLTTITTTEEEDFSAINLETKIDMDKTKALSRTTDEMK